MASMPDPVRSGVPQNAPGIHLTLSLKGQLVQKYTFDKPEVMIGRDPYCDVYVDNPGISRQHFKISRADIGEYRVTDLGSSNGTYLNDRPVKVGTLRDGDVLQFGKYSAVVQIEEQTGGDESGRRRHSVAEGATMMLSPAEVRQMVAEARGTTSVPGSAPKPGVVTRVKPEAERDAIAGGQRSWLPLVVIGVVVVIGAMTAFLITR